MPRDKIKARENASDWYYQHREYALARNAIYREQHREELREYFRTKRDKAKKSASDKLSRLKKLALYRARQRERYRKNKLAYVARAKRWAELNPEKARLHTQAKAWRRRGAPLTKSGKEYLSAISLDPCAYCGERTSGMVVDHIEPIVYGGTSEWSNLTLACRACNAAKAHKTLTEFLLLRRFGPESVLTC